MQQEAGAGYSAQPAARAYVEKPLTDLVQMAEDAEEASCDMRKLSERCRDYYDGAQLTSEELAALKRRGQPDVIINRVQTKVNYLLGYEATTRTDPRGFPRTPDDEEAAAACTDALNYVRDNSDQKMSFSQVWENMLIEGYGGVEIIPVLKDGDADFQVKRWHWDRLFFDPHSREHDFSDAEYLGGYIWMDLAKAQSKWPSAEAADAFAKTVSDSWSQTYDDRPNWRSWVSGTKRKRIRIVQMYYLCPAEDGSEELWHWCIFTKGGFIAKGAVPYRDQDGKSLCPLILQSAFTDRQNNRYGFVRALLSPQDEINKRRSKLLHEVNVRQVVIEQGAVDDVEITRRELTRPDGVVVVNPDARFELLDRSKEIAGHAQLMTEAKQEIDLMGPNAAMFGKGDKDASGRAILANQQGGQIEIAVLMDRNNHFKKRVHSAIWSMIRMYWTAQKWVRVTDDEDNVRFTRLNRPVSAAEMMLKQAVDQGIDEEEAKARLAEAGQDPMRRMELERIVSTDNVPAEMGMDIILEEIPDVANVQQEQFDTVSKLYAANPEQIPFKLIIKASSLRNKKELLQELEEAEEAANSNPLAEQAMQMQMEQAALTLKESAAKIDKLMAEIGKIRADSIKALADADAVDKQFGQITDPEIVDGAPVAEQAPNPQPWQGGGVPSSAPPAGAF